MRPNASRIRLPLLALILLLSSAQALADASRRAPWTEDSLRPSLAVTIDDLPVGPPSRHDLDQQTRITERLLAVLRARAVPAIGFVNEARLEREGELDPERVALLRRWLDAGMALGNHGYEHLSLHRVEPEIWIEDALRGDIVTRRLLAERGMTPVWFRHPYLHVGRSAEIQRMTAQALAERGYRIAPVTVDNGEWVYADAYARAWNANDRESMERIGRDYLRYMLEMVVFYENQSLAIVGEPIPQTLLIHANALNADYLGPLLDALSERGYRFVDLEQATKHPAYQRPIHGYTGPGGITWLHRWALTAGVDASVFRGEPEVPDWVDALRHASSVDGAN
ncbi:polysaccharide deacetylase family protein [Wenzhouxiangella marina]|uniref:Polysaccharide deacetylase n=1 Tax=Wenzhouxiangella marina TaxID=1579979 RepID=A0A0K0XVC4_9GAMM|nr:polysaccharide deacetylase family protein [Wenzhouxiangella marina]AKS41620.1 Polysaccharide deacetylase [Wenzhouxiangella marina]MBB6086621.1 peptidoglycan/xylan/chitin deacetylase (PgdA/CDA1 family) [Wenzhouxiangella marina]